MFQLYQHKPAVKLLKSRSDISKKVPAKKSGSSPHVCQMYCPNCGDPQCNYGSRCGNRQPVPGTYGYRRQDQRDFGTTGRTHEAEHAVGFAPANRNNTFSRNSREGRRYENALPAYQEERQYHRQHIGTGTRPQADASGFNSTTYRNAQQTLVADNQFAAAMQLNQLGYAFMPGFQTAPIGTPADRSFMRMASVPYIPAPNTGGSGYHAAPRTEQDRIEMEAARLATRTGQWPTESDIYRIRHQIGRRGQH